MAGFAFFVAASMTTILHSEMRKTDLHYRSFSDISARKKRLAYDNLYLKEMLIVVTTGVGCIPVFLTIRIRSVITGQDTQH